MKRDRVTGMLEDRGVMRAGQFRELEKAIHDYQQFAAQAEKGPAAVEEWEARWTTTSEHIERIHEAVHRLRDALRTDMVISCVAAEFPVEALPKLALRPPKPTVDLNRIRASLPTTDKLSQASRQVCALEVVDQLVAYVRTGLKAPGKADESTWPMYLMALANGYPGQPVAAAQEDDLAGESWRILDEGLRRRLKKSSPPITWGEIFFHLLKSLEDHRGELEADRRRCQIARYLAPNQEFYCMDCDRPFALDSRHPRRFICPRCRAKRRKRQERQRKRPNASIQ